MCAPARSPSASPHPLEPTQAGERARGVSGQFLTLAPAVPYSRPPASARAPITTARPLHPSSRSVNALGQEGATALSPALQGLTQLTYIALGCVGGDGENTHEIGGNRDGWQMRGKKGGGGWGKGICGG